MYPFIVNVRSEKIICATPAELSQFRKGDGRMCKDGSFYFETSLAKLANGDHFVRQLIEGTFKLDTIVNVWDYF